MQTFRLQKTNADPPLGPWVTLAWEGSESELLFCLATFCKIISKQLNWQNNLIISTDTRHRNQFYHAIIGFKKVFKNQGIILLQKWVGAKFKW